MKRVLALLLLVFIVVSIIPAHVSDEQYYLFPAIGYVGVSTDLPSGEMVEWVIDCTVFFKGVEIQNMIPTSDSVIDRDKYTARSFTLLEMFDVSISYCVRIFIHHNTLYLWSGELYVDGQTIRKMPYGEDFWAQYRCFDVFGDWSIGFYAVSGGNIQTSDNEILMALLLFFGLCFAIMIEKGLRWNQRRKEEE